MKTEEANQWWVVVDDGGLPDFITLAESMAHDHIKGLQDEFLDDDDGQLEAISKYTVRPVPAGLPENHVIAPNFRGYALMGAGAYLLNVCDGDENGPELVFRIATEAEKVGRTVGDLGDVVKGAEIPLETVAIRLQFKSLAGLDALEQQLAFVREELTNRVGTNLPQAAPDDAEKGAM